MSLTGINSVESQLGARESEQGGRPRRQGERGHQCPMHLGYTSDLDFGSYRSIPFEEATGDFSRRRA